MNKHLRSLQWWLKFMWAHALFAAVTGRLDLLAIVLAMAVPTTLDSWRKGHLPWGSVK